MKKVLIIAVLVLLVRELFVTPQLHSATAHGGLLFPISSDDTKPSDEKIQHIPYSSSFSACLLFKDDNVILPEWLAYHYTVLPLRRVIVGIDPVSIIDPTPIFELYRTIGMNITVWKNDSFWPFEDSQNFTFHNGTSYDVMRSRHKDRQKYFYQACLRQLRDEKRRWTILYDTDEYIAFNYFDDDEDYSQSQPDDGTMARIKLNQSSTVVEHINSHADPQFDKSTCIYLARYLFPSLESNHDVIQQGTDKVFNASFFNTLRYRYRPPLGGPQRGKSMVDASRYADESVKTPHKVLGNKCIGLVYWLLNTSIFAPFFTLSCSTTDRYLSNP